MTITDSVFRENTASGSCGAIDNIGTVSVFGTLFEQNAAASYGGAVNAYGGFPNLPGTISLEGCVFLNNSSGFGGGGVQISEATGVIIDCTFEGNSAVYGGGLGNRGTTSITGSEFRNNTAFGNGGGIDNIGSISVAGTLFEENNAFSVGGGFHTYGGFSGFTGSTTLNDSDFQNNSATYSGGGIQIDVAMATISGVALTGNSAGYYGGGLFNGYSGTSTLTNTTVSANSAGYYGGGLFNSGTASLTSVTIANNSTVYYDGGGVYAGYGSVTEVTNGTISGNSAGYYGSGGGWFNNYGTATLTNTIVAGNANSGGATDIQSLYSSFSGSNNLIRVGGSGGLINGVDGNTVGVASASLAPLGDYGGTTQTMALLPGSLAIDAGNNSVGPTTDQRGISRFGSIDIGAFESQGFQIALVAGSTPQTSDIGTAFSNPLAVSVTANNPLEPVDGGFLRFTTNPAANGATAIFLDAPAVISGGQAGITAAPNNILGSYTVIAAIPGSSVTFDLTNAGQVYTSLIVNTTSDELAPGPGLLSLREAIAFADTDQSVGSVITFDPTVFSTAQTITLTGGQLRLTDTDTTTITGPGADLLAISGNHASRILEVNSGAVNISGVTLTDGYAATGDGGAILNFGALTVSDAILTGNYEGPGGNGGGAVLSVGENSHLTIDNTIISNNFASFTGGGISLIDGGTLTVSSSTFITAVALLTTARPR